jgi:hypothetical protein
MTLPAATAGNNRLPGLVRRYWSVVLIAVTTTIVCALQPFDNGPAIRSDGFGYHAWTYAILRGDLSFEGVRNDTYAFHETRPGYWWNVYPPGVALARLPVMLPLAAASDRFGHPTPAEHVAAVVLSALALMATALLLHFTCRAAGAGDGPTNVAVLAVVFGTGLFHYATYDASYSHVWSALGFSALVALAARSARRGGSISAPALVLLASWLMLVRNTNAFALVILAGSYLLLARRYLGVPVQSAFRNVAWLAVGTALGTAVQLALNTYAHARFNVSSYAGELFIWDRPMQWSVLTSVAEHGLFPYYPVTAFLLLLPLSVLRLWPFVAAFALVLATYCTLYGYWTMWNLGASFGHRGFVEVVPLGAPLLAVALTSIGKWPRRIAIVAVFLCVYATSSLMAGYWRRSVPYHEISTETYRTHIIGREQLLLVASRSFR